MTGKSHAPVAEKTPPRSKQEVDEHYTAQCAKVGHAYYQKLLVEAQLQKEVQELDKINQEGFERKRLDAETTSGSDSETVSSEPAPL